MNGDTIGISMRRDYPDGMYGELTHIDYANGTYVDYEYDSLGRIGGLYNVDPYGMPICCMSYQYNRDSNVTSVMYFQGDTEFSKTYAYDNIHRLTEEKKLGPGGNTLYSYTYDYDAVGNRTQLVNFDGSQTITTSYTYNNLNQLTQRVVDSGPDQGTWTYQYDFNGNMFKRTRPTSSLDDFYFYNVDDRMVRVDMLEGIESVSQFEYDAMGRRLISTDDDGNKTLYYYDGIRVILEKIKPSGSGTWSTSKVYTLQGGAIGFIVSSRDTSTGDDTWYHYDRLGTVMNLTDATGAVTATYSQDAFGNILSGNDAGYHFSTKEYYLTIKLYSFYERWYNAHLGRFTQKASPYTISNNNPNNSFEDDRKAFIECAKKEKPECERKWTLQGCRWFADCMCGNQGSRLFQCLKEMGIILSKCKIEHRKGLLHDRCLLVCDGKTQCWSEKPGLFPPFEGCIDNDPPNRPAPPEFPWPPFPPALQGL